MSTPGRARGLAEHDRHGREPDLALGDPVGDDARPNVVEFEDLRVALLRDHCARGIASSSVSWNLSFPAVSRA